MAFGRGYTAGSTPVDIHGKSIVDLSKTGGWIAAFFIFGTSIHSRICIFRWISLYCFFVVSLIYIDMTTNFM